MVSSTGDSGSVSIRQSQHGQKQLQVLKTGAKEAAQLEHNSYGKGVMLTEVTEEKMTTVHSISHSLDHV